VSPVLGGEDGQVVALFVSGEHVRDGANAPRAPVLVETGWDPPSAVRGVAQQAAATVVCVVHEHLDAHPALEAFDSTVEDVEALAHLLETRLEPPLFLNEPLLLLSPPAHVFGGLDHARPRRATCFLPR